MRLAPTTFAASPAATAELLSSLRDSGFETSDATRVTFTVLDTLDGRLHRNGLRLVATRSGELSLTLTDPAVSHGTVSADALPVRATDLPSGEMREVVVAVTGERLLLAQATVVAARVEASLRRSSGELLSLVTVDEKLHLAGRRKAVAGTATVHRVAGRGKSRRRVEALCLELDMETALDDVLSTVLDKAGVDLNGVSRSPAAALEEATTALDGFRAVLTHLFTAVEGNWKGAANSHDPSFVHGLRVAVRRSRSVLLEGKTVLPRDALATANAGLGFLGTSTGPARDLDVYLAEWEGYMSPLAPETITALRPVRELLETRREAAYNELAVGLRSAQMRTFMREWGRWLRKPVTPRSSTRRPDSERELAPFVVECIERAHLTLLENGRLITDDSPATQVHDLRRDAKRLRYLLECFGGLLPPKATKQFVRRLKSLQDNLGEHQDAEVHAHQLAALVQQPDAKRLAGETLAAADLLVQHLEQRCHTARTEFSSRFAEYDSVETQTALARILSVEQT